MEKADKLSEELEPRKCRLDYCRGLSPAVLRIFSESDHASLNLQPPYPYTVWRIRIWLDTYFWFGMDRY